MKKIVGIMATIIGFFSFAMANTPEQEENLLVHEEEMIIELDQKELPIITTQEQREIRCEQKQEIKNQILVLYKELKDEKIKGIKKETRHQISELKKQLRTINSKIAYSYKQQFKRFFWLK
jgi:uncharacterized FlaG/YvyC family protein